MTSRLALVTGAAGFIASHLVEELLRQGWRVRAMVRYSSDGKIGFLSEIGSEAAKNLEIFYGDIRDARAVRIAAEGCSRIYHLAALIGIPYSYLAPESYVDVNIRGTLNILEAARSVGTERTMVTSTSEVYGTAIYAPIDEKHPLQPQSPYSASKISADCLAESYYRSFGLPVTIVRPFNTYGPRQSTRAIIPTIFSQALASDKIELGSLSPVRDLVFVEDTAKGFLALGECEAAIGRVTNLATGHGVTVGSLVERIQKIVGSNKPVVESSERVRPAKSEVFKLIGSAEIAGAIAGWKPSVTLDEGLARTFEWMKRNVDKYQVGVYRV